MQPLQLLIPWIPLVFAALPQEGGVHPPSPVERYQESAVKAQNLLESEMPRT